MGPRIEPVNVAPELPLSITQSPGRRSRLVLLVCVLASVPAVGARAQRVLSPFEDATVLRRGQVRVSVAPVWSRWHERFADGLGATPKGTAEPAGIDYDLASFGVAQLPSLAATETAVGAIVGAPSAAASLGRLQTRFEQSFTVTQLGLEFGATRRLTLGAMLPVVQSRTEVSLNPDGTTGNVGLNPGFDFPGARQANSQVVTQLTAATQALQALLTTCAGSTTAQCAAVNADRPRAEQLVATAGGVATGIEQLFGTSTARPGLPIVPIERGTLHAAVAARLAALATDFATFLGAPTGATTWVDGRPVGAPPLAFADFQQILTDTTFGIVADSLVHVDRSWIGDVEFGAKFLLFDTFGAAVPQQGALGGIRARLAIGALYRIGSAHWKLPTVFADPGSGDSQDDIEGRVAADVALGRRFWFSLIGRYTSQRPDAQILRIPRVAHDPFPPLANQVLLDRDLGDAIAAEFSPRLIVAPSAAVSASYAWYSKSEDLYAYRGSPPTGAPSDPSPLTAGTARSEQRISVAVTYSTMASYYAGRARLPLEVSYMMGRTIAGEGNSPKQNIVSFMLRVYNQLF
jgi:hypothetical protein